ncbi:MAG: dicarboxylate/amino acid:cation symporter [Bacteroidia bacterium]|jgi:Na+/H+-dicarboxylate symporter|nr:dicarboxylate/amino acid:cation symporter [Bacteroidia bacterium]
MKRLLSLPLHWLILLGMLAGILFGVAAVALGLNEFTALWIKPWGTIFINLLKLIAIPLIVVSLISGIAGLGDVGSLSRIGLKTISFYIVTTVVAVTVGLVVANLIAPGYFLSPEKSAEFQARFAQSAAVQAEQRGPLQFVVDLVPDNIFAALSQNSRMLQVIFFSLLFGIALIRVGNGKAKFLKDIFVGLNEVVMQMIHMIMYVAPLGVFALMAGIITDVAGNNPADTLSLFASLGMYALTVVVGLLLLIFAFYPVLIHFFTRLKYRQFLKGIAPAQLLAFSTSSSAATLPMTMQCCEENLKVKNEVASFVLPLGATVNMDGTSLYQAVAAVFLAQIYGMDLTLAQQLTIILTATLASIGSAAVPGAGMIMLVIVLGAVGIPAEGIALIFAVDRPLDMLRTVVNITGDASVTCIVATTENKMKPEHS